jgi:hypothetical protein
VTPSSYVELFVVKTFLVKIQIISDEFHEKNLYIHLDLRLDVMFRVVIPKENTSLFRYFSVNNRKFDTHSNQ